MTDSDSDGLFDYLESNIIDSDGDGYKNHEDPNNQDACLPDTSLCSVSIPAIIPIFYYILGLLLIITGYMRLDTRLS